MNKIAVNTSTSNSVQTANPVDPTAANLQQLTLFLANNPHKLSRYQSVNVRQFSCAIDYEQCLQAMQSFVSLRLAQSANAQPQLDEIWILQHNDVLSLGVAAKPEHILQATLPVVRSDRGGQVTWHGTGQVVVYPLLNLTKRNWHARTLVDNTEQLVIQWLAGYGISALANPEAPGVYVQGSKIASLGYKIKKAYCYHGFAININCALAGFNSINPCGHPNLPITTLARLLSPAPITVEVALSSLLPLLLERFA